MSDVGQSLHALAMWQSSCNLLVFFVKSECVCGRLHDPKACQRMTLVGLGCIINV
jgi:hypothetical protein